MDTAKASTLTTVIGIFEFVPIIVFVYLQRDAGRHFRASLLICGALALAMLIVNRVIKRRMSSLALAVNIFLLIEGLGHIMYIAVVANVFRFLEESVLFIVTFAVGVMRTYVSPAGFVDVVSGNAAAVKRASLYLLLGVLVGLGISMAFRGHMLFAGVLPFVALGYLYRVLRQIASRSAVQAA